MAMLQAKAHTISDPGKRVKFLRSCQERNIDGDLFIFEPDDVAHVSTKTARRLLWDGWATEVTDSNNIRGK